MKLSDTQVEEYKRLGVLSVGRMLDNEQVAEAVRHIDALFAEGKVTTLRKEGQGIAYKVLSVEQHDPWFLEVIQQDSILDVAESILGPNLQFYQTNLFMKPPGVFGSTDWHQDNIWWGARPPDVLTIWIALDKVSKDNGAVHYLPGSHHEMIPGTTVRRYENGNEYLGLSDGQIAEHVDFERLIHFDLDPGEGVMHHCQTFHGTFSVDAPRWRRGLTVHLSRAGLFPDDTRPVLRGQKPPPVGSK